MGVSAEMSKQVKLDKLQQQIRDDNVCPELAKQATQLVFGTGNPNADIVFIGEAPGKKEDIKGVPFIGAAGRFLDEMLALIKMDRKDVYITNIVKYRPPNNRDPLPEEKKVFLPYLQAQLEIIQPQVVITLGRHSMNCFLPDLQISQVHGKPQKISLCAQDEKSEIKKRGSKKEAVSSPISDPQSSIFEVVILPLFHPAAALYNGGLRQTLIDDFMAIPSIIKQLQTKS